MKVKVSEYLTTILRNRAEYHQHLANFAARKTMVVQRSARFQMNLGNLRLSQDICYARMTDNNGFLSIYGHRANLLKNRRIERMY